MRYDDVVTPENNVIEIDQVSIKIDVDEQIQLTVHSMTMDLSSYEELNPVTPLYQIEADGKFFDTPVILTYPHKEEDEALNLAFYNDTNLINWFVNNEEADFAMDMYVFEATKLGEYLMEAMWLSKRHVMAKSILALSSLR